MRSDRSGWGYSCRRVSGCGTLFSSALGNRFGDREKTRHDDDKYLKVVSIMASRLNIWEPRFAKLNIQDLDRECPKTEVHGAEEVGSNLNI
jgi:hypothetical protein